MPTAIIVRYSNGVYSTDSDEKIDEEGTLLTQLVGRSPPCRSIRLTSRCTKGTMLEHFLVRSRESFASLQKSSAAPSQVQEKQSYQYTLVNFLLSSVMRVASIQVLCRCRLVIS